MLEIQQQKKETQATLKTSPHITEQKFFSQSVVINFIG